MAALAHTAAAPAPAVTAALTAVADTPRERALSSLARAARSGGPQDKAFFTCHCANTFTAAPTANIVCPHCGTGQAW